MGEERVKELVTGLRRLRKGALLYFVAFTLSFILLIWVLPSILASILLTPSLQAIWEKGVFTRLLVLLAGGLAFGIPGFIFWFKATGNLKRYNPRLGIGRVGIILPLLSALLLLVAVTAVLIAIPAVGVFKLPSLSLVTGVTLALAAFTVIVASLIG